MTQRKLRVLGLFSIGFILTFASSILAVIALTLISTNSFAQSAPPSADTFTNSEAPNKNYGAQIALVVQSGANSYLKFNLGTLPSGVGVSKATLRLFVDAVVASGKFDVYQLNNSWSEGTLTYNNAPALGASATSNNPIAVTGSSLNQFVVIDITLLVQGWVNSHITNNGLALALVGSNGSFSFDSKESIFTSHQPELEIALTGPAGAQGPKGDTGATGAQGPQGPIGQTGATGPQGPMGLTGPQGPAGTNGTNGTNGAGFNFTGPFNSATNYNPYDVVTYNGSTYDATTAIASGGATPDTNVQWQLMAQAGAAGALGPTGAKGDTGATGAQGPQGQTGATGAQGPIGVDGPQGPIGPQGPQGLTGDANARMIFPSFFPGNLSGTWLGGKLILDQPITVLRIAATAKTPTASGCPAAVFRFTDGTKGQDLALTPGQYWSDTGSMVMTFAAGAALQASLRTGSTCASNPGADANLLVEYKMQAAGDTDNCTGTSCAGFCTTLTSDPSNCGTCGTACSSGTPCVDGSCASGGCGTGPACTTGQQCVAGACVCNATSCPTGCCNGNTCTTPSLSACGTAGSACVACTTGQVCSGACSNCEGGQTCGNSCATRHSDGVGQVFYDCNPLGTYSSTEAIGAGTAYESSVGGTSANVSDGWQCGVSGPTFVCAQNADGTCNNYCWGYSGSTTGSVSSCSCPFTKIASWN